MHLQNSLTSIHVQTYPVSIISDLSVQLRANQIYRTAYNHIIGVNSLIFINIPHLLIESNVLGPFYFIGPNCTLMGLDPFSIWFYLLNPFFGFTGLIQLTKNYRASFQTHWIAHILFTVSTLIFRILFLLYRINP